MDPIIPRDFTNFSLPHFENPVVSASRRQESLMRELLTGEATFVALGEAIQDLVGSAPKDHDVLIQAFDIFVLQVRFVQPHTLFFRGFDQSGNHTSVVAHYSQVIARVIYLPKRGPDRVITGFWREPQ